MKRLLLIGAGHAHAQVLKDWISAPVAGCALTLVSPSALAPYSGMVPGWLAGTYRFEAICINFEALAAAAGAQLVIDELAALDPNRRSVQLRSGTVLGYDLLSLNVGSTLTPPTPTPTPTLPSGREAVARSGRSVLSLRPLGGLHSAWEALLADTALNANDTPLTVMAVGGGAAGVESLLATLARLRSMRPGRPLQASLLSRSDTLLPGMAPAAVRAARAALATAGATVQLGSSYDEAADEAADETADEATNEPAARPINLLLWATGAEAHAWQRASGLAVSARGFIRIDAHLRSLSHPQVYAVGDCAEWAAPLPKAGVFAVRMGPVLSRNLRAALGAGEASPYVPQRRYLALLDTADGRAIAAWGRWSFQGRWVWRWKHRIDCAFLKRFEIGRHAEPAPTLTPTPSKD